MPDPLARLGKSAFRRRFRLAERDHKILDRLGEAGTRDHAHALLAGRIGNAAATNDGRQTPMRGHPVFVAQHTTATCCRKCVFKWYRVPAGRALEPPELGRLVELVMVWIKREHVVFAPTRGSHQLSLL